MGMEITNRYFARSDGLVVQDMGDELLVYDRREDVAHCLSGAAASVWRGCQDGATRDELAAGADLGDGLVDAALEELAAKQLLDAPLGRSGVTRRHALRRMAGVGAAAVAA